MAITVERMVAVLEARVDKFEKSVSGAKTKFSGDMKAITTAGTQMEASVRRIGGSAAKSMEALKTSSANAAYQQKNLQMQLADVGQSLALGMSPLQVLLQQGPQIASIYGAGEGGIGRALKETGTMIATLVTRFAPLLAVLAAGYAAYKLLASSTAAANREVDETTKALAEQAAPVGSLKGMIGDLADAQKAYADAIETTAEKQVASSNTIISATKAEFEAKRQLFELELKRQQASIAVQRAAIAQLGADMRGRIDQQVLTRDDRIRQGTADPLVGDLTINADRLEAVKKTLEAINADPATDEIKKLRAELVLNEIEAGRMSEVLKNAWDGTPIEIEKTSKAVKSSADAARDATDAWEGLRQVSDSVKAAQEAAAAQAKITAEKLEAVASTTASAMGDIRRGFIEGKSAVEVFGNAALNVLDKIASAIETQLANSLVNALAGQSGGFSWLGALFGATTAVPGLGSVIGTGSGYFPPAPTGVLKQAPGAPLMAGAKAQQSVHVTVGVVKNGLNLEPEVVAVASKVGKAGLDQYRRGQLTQDIQRNPRRKG